MNLKKFPTIDIHLFTLRQLKKQDVNQIFEIRSNKEISKYTNRPLAQNIEEAKEFIIARNKGIEKRESLFWAITEKATDKCIGTICLWNFTIDYKEADIGYELLPTYQGKGIMNKSVQAVIQFAFQTIHLQKIIGVTNPQNLPSINLLLRNNFSYQKELLENEVHLNVYELNDRNWLSVTSD